MRLVPSLAQEFEEMCEHYSTSSDPAGKDIVILVKMFGDQYDHLRSETEPDFRGAWEKFLDEHKSQISVSPMAGLILYILVTYWDMGPMFWLGLPTLERMLVRDTIQEISEEINRRSVANGNAVVSS